MSKMMKVIAMLLVIAAILFVSGCTSNAPTAENKTPAAPANETNVTTVTPTETPVMANNTTGNVTGNVTENNTAAPTATH